MYGGQNSQESKLVFIFIFGSNSREEKSILRNLSYLKRKLTVCPWWQCAGFLKHCCKPKAQNNANMQLFTRSQSPCYHNTVLGELVLC